MYLTFWESIWSFYYHCLLEPDLKLSELESRNKKMKLCVKNIEKKKHIKKPTRYNKKT